MDTSDQRGSLVRVNLPFSPTKLPPLLRLNPQEICSPATLPFHLRQVAPHDDDDAHQRFLATPPVRWLKP